MNDIRVEGRPPILSWKDFSKIADMVETKGEKGDVEIFPKGYTLRLCYSFGVWKLSIELDGGGNGGRRVIDMNFDDAYVAREIPEIFFFCRHAEGDLPLACASVCLMGEGRR